MSEEIKSADRTKNVLVEVKNADIVKSVLVEYKSGVNEEFADVDFVNCFKDRDGIEWLFVAWYRDDPHMNRMKGRDTSQKVNIPISNINKYQTFEHIRKE